jgi:hypothetical protein
MTGEIDFTVIMSAPTVQNVTMNPPAVTEVTFQQQQGISGRPGADGVQGRQGDPGIPGIPGPMGTTYTFTQASPSALWTIVHNLNRFPSVEVTDSSGRIVEGDEQYVDANTLTVAFSAPFSGEAYLN